MNLDSDSSTHNHKKPQTIKEAISFLYTQSGSVDDFRETKKIAENHPEEVLASIQTFYCHPYLAGPCNILDEGMVSYPVEQDEFELAVVDIRYADSPEIPIEDFDSDDIDYMSEYVDEDGESHGLYFRGSTPIAGTEQYLEPEKRVEARNSLPLPPIPPLMVLRAMEADPKEVPEIQMISGKPIPDPETDTVYWVEVDRISNSGNPVVDRSEGEFILDEGSPGKYYAVLKANDSWIAVAEAQ
jgi:hypothetical protein